MTTKGRSMSAWVNFAEIRAKVSLELVLLDYYGITNLHRDGDKLVGPCPVHMGDSPRAFHADLVKNIWHCFSRCQKGGNQLDLVAMKEGLSIREAALKLQARFLGGSAPPEGRSQAGPAQPPTTSTPPTAPSRDSPSTTPKSTAREVERNPPISIELRLRSDHPHLIETRRLTVATCDHFGVGYCTHGTMRGTIAIPIHDETGALIAYAGRRLKPEDIRTHGKYKLPKGFRKELVLYNLQQAAESGRSRGIILVEGFFAVLALHQGGFDNAVAAMGCELSGRQVELLRAFPEVVLLFDGDEAGRVGAQSARAKLAEITVVRVIHLPEGMKPDDLTVRALKWLVNGVQLLDLEEVRYVPRPSSSKT